MKTKIISLFISLCAFISCTQPVVEVFGSISGYVVSENNGEAVSGARVTISPTGSSQVTAVDGEFLFDNLDPQEYTLSIKKDGYQDMSQKVSVKAALTSTVQVLLKPIQPALKVEPSVLDFGNESSSLALDITNTGKGTLEWIIEEDVEWLICSQQSGTTTDEVSSVVVKVSRDGLERGTYSETIVISSNGGSATINVKMSVGNSIILTVEPSELDFGTAESEREIIVKNNGVSTVKYSVSSANDWLTLSKSSSSVLTTDYLNAIVSREGLSAGSYTSSITISTGDGDLVIPVKMQVAAKSVPSVTMEDVKDISYSSANATGTIVSVGSSKVFRFGFCISTENEEPTVEDQVYALGDCTEPKVFSATLTNLDSDTVYYIRAFAENQEGIAYSGSQYFTTAEPPKPAEVLTEGAEDITENTATLRGELVSTGGSKVIVYGHVLGLDENVDNEDNWLWRTKLYDASEPVKFRSEFTQLDPNTTYFVRAYATNEMGTVYSEAVCFTTDKKPLVVVTKEPTEITANSVSLSAEITYDEGHEVEEKGFMILSLDDDSSYEVVASNDFTATVTGLSSNMRYMAYAYVETYDGYYYDEGWVTFTTLDKEPVLVVLDEPSDITTGSVYLSADILSSEGHMVVEKGFLIWLYGDTDSYMDIVASDDFDVIVEGLTDNTEYGAMAYVKTSEGRIYYSDGRYFTTLEAPKNPTNGLYAYYTFENDTKNTVAGAVNASGINVSYVDGKQGTKALKFTTKDALLNVPEPLIDGRDFTISFWVKDLNDGHIFDVVTSSSYKNSNVLAMLNGRLRYVQSGFCLWRDWNNEEDAPLFTHSTLSSDWHHVAITSTYSAYLRSEVCLYLDGECVDKITTESDDIGTGTKFVFGGPLTRSGYSLSLNWIAMTIDNLRIYNSRVLTADEVKQIYEYEK